MNRISRLHNRKELTEMLLVGFEQGCQIECGLAANIIRLENEYNRQLKQKYDILFS